jgi:hypothetical protein
VRICVIAAAGWALIAPVGAWAQTPRTCQTIAGAVCGAGNGFVSSVSGDISLGRGGAVSQIGSGDAILGGDRILARDGTAQVSLGPTCVASIPANSISVVTRQNGLTCLQLSNPPGEAATGPGFDPLLVGVGLAAVAGVGAAIAIGTSHSSSGGHSSSNSLSP